MRHQQYREGPLEKLRKWKLENPEGTFAEGREPVWLLMKDEDKRLFYDNWYNTNFDRIEIKEQRPGSVAAVVRPRRDYRDRQQRSERLATEAITVHQMITRAKSNLYDDFAKRIWDTPLPSGVALRDATGKDMAHAGGWFGVIAKKMKPTEKVFKKFSTKQLFDLSQRKEFAAA